MKIPSKRISECECEEQQMSGSLKDQIWQSQLGNREIIINEEIGDSIIEKAVMQVFNINAFDDESEVMSPAVQLPYERPPIKIYLNSHGGALDEAFSLISAIESSKTPVITIALGKAWSAAFLILLSGHVRLAQKYSSLMLHQGSAGIVDTFGKMLEYAKYWESCQKKIDELILGKTKINKKQLDQNFTHKQDWYLDSQEALKLGIIDEII